MPYVLKEVLASRSQGIPIWFREMTAIGPRSTADPEQRETFATERAAMLCPAYSHPIAIYEVEEVTSPTGPTPPPPPQ